MNDVVDPIFSRHPGLHGWQEGGMKFFLVKIKYLTHSKRSSIFCTYPPPQQFTSIWKITKKFKI